MRTFGIFELNIPIPNMGRSVFFGFLFVQNVSVREQNVAVCAEMRECSQHLIKNTAKADFQKLARHVGLKSEYYSASH